MWQQNEEENVLNYVASHRLQTECRIDTRLRHTHTNHVRSCKISASMDWCEYVHKDTFFWVEFAAHIGYIVRKHIQFVCDTDTTVKLAT